MVWDRDIIGKDYLGEVSIACQDWFKHNGGLQALGFGDPKNSVRAHIIACWF